MDNAHKKKKGMDNDFFIFYFLYKQIHTNEIE